MITKKEVCHIAKLARIGLTQEEIEKFQKELSAVLDYVETLKEVDISKIAPTSHSIEIENVMREDCLSSDTLVGQPDSLKMEKVKRLLDLAPETKNGYLKVKSIF